MKRHIALRSVYPAIVIYSAHEGMEEPVKKF